MTVLCQMDTQSCITCQAIILSNSLEVRYSNFFVKVNSCFSKQPVLKVIMEKMQYVPVF